MRTVARIVTAAVVAAAAVVALPAAPGARDCQSWGASPPAVGSDDNVVADVAAAGPCLAWAVGYADGETLVLGWNGRRWRRVPSPSPGLSTNLEDATSLRDGTSWAVGYFSDGSADQPLILRWNGFRWKRQQAPPLEDGGTLRGVAAASDRNAWTVGIDANAFPQGWLVLHWNGRSWRRASTPLAGSGQSSLILNGVTRVPGGGAWAVGDYVFGGRRLPYALHCC
jgi:hypothetical protein